MKSKNSYTIWYDEGHCGYDALAILVAKGKIRIDERNAIDCIHPKIAIRLSVIRMRIASFPPHYKNVLWNKLK